MNSTSLDATLPTNKAQELIAASIQALIAQLEVGNSEAFIAYLTAMSRFHQYSFGNVLSISMQRPDATQVAGFHMWRKLGHNVKKGERGIRILAPIISKRRQKDDTAQDDPKVHGPRLAGFRSVYVFDVSQTEGAELPVLRGVSGDVGENRDRLFAFVQQQGIELSFSDGIAPAMGMSYGGKITLLPGQSKAEEFTTLVHEVSHELLHRNERRALTTKIMRETEAEDYDGLL